MARQQGRPPEMRGEPRPIGPGGIQQAVRGEIRRLAGSVGDPRDLATYAGLEEQAEQLSPGSRKRQSVERRMRRLGPPTETQIFLRRLLGFGAIGALAILTLITGEQTIAHATLLHGNLVDVQSTLNHLDIFHIGSDMQRIIGDLQTAETNAVQAVVSGTETGAGVVAEVAVVSQKPWSRPRRRGWFF